MQTKEKLLENVSLIKKKEVVFFLEKVHLSYSELKEILEILEEIEYIKDKDALEILLNTEKKFAGNKKKDGKLLFEEIRKIRYPKITETIQYIDKRVKSIKNSKIKLNYPQNLEGEGIKLELNIKSEKDIERILRHLEKNELVLKEIVKAVNSGGV